MTSFFLSYARTDDGEPFDPASSFVARLHRDLTVAGLDVWFDRVSMPSRSLTFHQEIRDAVATYDRLVLVVGPKAAESLYVRQEWQFAYFEAEKIVTPILRLGDYPNVPDELKLLHCEDFRDDAQYDFHLKNLIRQLAEPAPALGKLIGVPSLPPHFLSRTERLTALRDALRVDLDRPVVITGAAARVGMHGMGGIGKSVLAATLSRDRKVREAFPDGIVWVGLGPLPTVADLQRRVHKDLAGDGAFQTEHEGRVKLREILKDKGVLLILDDVWRRQDVDWFDVLGPRCRAMITTRDSGLLTSLGGVHHQVELLTDAEALNLLGQAAGVERDKLPREAADLIAECGRLPLAVALCGGMVLGGTPWRHVIEALREHDLEFPSDPQSAQPQHVNLWRAMEVSVDMLAEHADNESLLKDAARSFAELAAFPSDEPIPAASICTLWSHTGGLGERHAHKLLTLLKHRSLVQMSGNTFSLHALLFDLAIRLSQRDIGDVKRLNNLVIEAYAKKCPDGWHVDPPNDGYFFTHLRHHLISAGRANELADLLHELRWLEAKNEAGLTFDLTTDFAEAIKELPEAHARQRTLRLLDDALRRDIYFIARHEKEYPQGLFQCLWNNGWWYDCDSTQEYYETEKADGVVCPWFSSGPRLCSILEKWRSERAARFGSFQWLRSMRPPLTPLNHPLVKVLVGHSNSIDCVAFSPCGSYIYSGSWDKSVKVWNMVTGNEVQTLVGDDDWIKHLSLQGDGSLVAASYNSIMIWDLKTRTRLATIVPAAKGFVTAFSRDGRYFAKATDASIVVQQTGKNWTRGLRHLHDGEVSALCFSADTSRIACASHDGTISVWDMASRTAIFRVRFSDCRVAPIDCVKGLSFSAEGDRLAAGCERTLRVWNVSTGKEEVTLNRHRWQISSVCYSPDGRYIATASKDQSVRVFDSWSGQERFCLDGHESAVNCIAFSPDGRFIVSGSSDQTVRVWDLSRAMPQYKLRRHESEIHCLAFSPDGRLLATSDMSGRVITWDVASGLPRHEMTDHNRWVNSLLFSRDSRWLMTRDAVTTVRVWDTATGKLVCERSCPPPRTSIVSHDLSPDGVYLACGLNARTHGEMVVFDCRDPDCYFAGGDYPGSDSIVAFSADGRKIASGSSDGVINVYSFPDGDQIADLRGHTKKVLSLAFTADDSQLISVSDDDTARVWNMEDRECIRVIMGWRWFTGTAPEQLTLPLQAKVTDDYISVFDQDTGFTLAHYPAGKLCPIATHPSDRIWCGVKAMSLYLLCLETA